MDQIPPTPLIPTNTSAPGQILLNSTTRSWPSAPFYHEFSAAGSRISINITDYGDDAGPTEYEGIKHDLWDILWSIYGSTKAARKEMFRIPYSISRGDVRANFWGDIHPLPLVTRGQVGQVVDEVYNFVLDYGPREIATAKVQINGQLVFWFELDYWAPATSS